MPKTKKPLTCEPVAGPPVLRCRVYSPEEIAEWERHNTAPPPNVDPRAAAWWRQRRADAARVERMLATRGANRAADSGERSP